MEAHLLSLNDFGMPLVLDDTHAMYTNIIYLLLLEKGKFQSHPNMGVDIRHRYRFNNNENFLQSLRTDISDQINTYLPELAMIDINLTIKGTTLGILINTEAGAYAIAYNESSGIDAPAAYILDNL